ncbi:glycosyltransferase family 2 protein [Ekhidna sp.]|uniref:glycosyltransferase family 2 protein n=1 Tax=Ekhidna sp. TaxID=2608089 RepID=UPI0032EE35D9
MSELVSIITPVFNAEKFLRKTIDSVLNQVYETWELLIIDDGSTDLSLAIAKSFSDERIRVFHQENFGVGAARNLGLQKMKGAFFCFLDADDILPPNAINSRILKFRSDRDLNFVDGVVIYVNDHLEPMNECYRPAYTGRPLDRLIALDRSCLFGNTWMIKKLPNVLYWFDEDMTHAEDLYFYITICSQHNGRYDFVNDEVLWYRQTDSNTMKNLKGLEDGYYKLINRIVSQQIGSFSQRVYLKARVTRIMALSHLLDGKDIFSAFRCLLKYWI